MEAYTLIRSSHRTLGLEIAPDLSVVVRAPRRCPQAEIDRFVASHEVWIATHRERQRVRNQSPAAQPVSPEEETRLRALAAQVLPARVAYYAAQMGVSPTGIRITSAKKRFGSCNSRRGLCFSWRLMAYPPAAVDYVVVHELAHIRQMNHSPAFYAVVAQVLPDYRERARLLRG